MGHQYCWKPLLALFSPEFLNVAVNKHKRSRIFISRGYNTLVIISMPLPLCFSAQLDFTIQLFYSLLPRFCTRLRWHLRYKNMPYIYCLLKTIITTKAQIWQAKVVRLKSENAYLHNTSKFVLYIMGFILTL